MAIPHWTDIINDTRKLQQFLEAATSVMTYDDETGEFNVAAAPEMFVVSATASPGGSGGWTINIPIVPALEDADYFAVATSYTEGGALPRLTDTRIVGKSDDEVIVEYQASGAGDSDIEVLIVKL